MADNLINCTLENDGVIFTATEYAGDRAFDDNLVQQVYGGATLDQGVYRFTIYPNAGFYINMNTFKVGGVASSGVIGGAIPPNYPGITEANALNNSGASSWSWADDNINLHDAVANVYLYNTLGLPASQCDHPNNTIEVTVVLHPDYVIGNTDTTINIDIDGEGIVYTPPAGLIEFADDAATPFNFNFTPIWINPSGSSVQALEIAPENPLGINFTGAAGLIDMSTEMTDDGWGINWVGTEVFNEANIDYTFGTYILTYLDDPPEEPPSIGYPTFVPAAGCSGNSYDGECYFTAQSDTVFDSYIYNFHPTYRYKQIRFKNWDTQSSTSLNVYNTSFGLSNLPPSISWYIRIRQNGFSQPSNLSLIASSECISFFEISSRYGSSDVDGALVPSYNIQGGARPLDLDNVSLVQINDQEVKVTIPLNQDCIIPQSHLESTENNPDVNYYVYFSCNPVASEPVQ